MSKDGMSNLYDVPVRAKGPIGSLPLTPEMLRMAPLTPPAPANKN